MLFQLAINSPDKVTEVYMNHLKSEGYIIAIPEIHWSISLAVDDSKDNHYEHILHSLMFQLFQGNAERLTKEILKLLDKHFL